MSAGIAALGIASCLLAGLAGALGARSYSERAGRARRLKAAYGTQLSRMQILQPGDGEPMSLRYLKMLTRRLYANMTAPLSPAARKGRAEKTRAGAWFKSHAKHAGLSKEVSAAAYCEARIRLAFLGGVAGALAGLVLSTELGVLLGIAGALLAGSVPRRATGAACRRRSAEAQMHLSEMLEVVALGLRSGLTFDRSFALYGSHFDSGFAQSCAKAHRSWTLGLITREEALREFAASYDCDQLARVVDSVVRSLRFGSALSDILEEAALQSRASYRSILEERVAKAPVKMMLPTGTLILPAMLLLVLGPVLLELAGGF